MIEAYDLDDVELVKLWTIWRRSNESDDFNLIAIVQDKAIAEITAKTVGDLTVVPAILSNGTLYFDMSVKTHEVLVIQIQQFYVQMLRERAP